MSARPKNWPGSTLSWRRLPRAVQRGKRQPFAMARRSPPGSGSPFLPPCSWSRHWADAHGQTHTRTAAGSCASGAPVERQRSLAWLQGLVVGALVALATSTALLLAVLLAPAMVAFIFDRAPGRPVARSVALCGMAACVGPELALWGPVMTSRPPPGCWLTFGPSVSPGRHAPPDGSSPNWRRSACGRYWMRSAWPVPPGSGPGGASSRRSGDSAGCRIRQHGNRPDCCGTLDACNNRHSCKQHHQP